MKKTPAKKFEKESGLKPFIATMAAESNLRKTEYLKKGCNSFNSDDFENSIFNDTTV